MVLWIDACVRPQSRTRILAQSAVQTIADRFEHVELLRQHILPLDEAALAKREEYVRKADYTDNMFRFARQFKQADVILIAAPYWDLSFPSVLKCYLESVCVHGLTFRYNAQGIPEGLCSAKRLIYVTTAGGFIPEHNFGFDYVQKLCTDFFGIRDTVCIKAEGLDIDGADVRSILDTAQKEIKQIIGKDCIF